MSKKKMKAILVILLDDDIRPTPTHKFGVEVGTYDPKTRQFAPSSQQASTEDGMVDHVMKFARKAQ